jgi:hypothetical protein
MALLGPRHFTVNNHAVRSFQGFLIGEHFWIETNLRVYVIILQKYNPDRAMVKRDIECIFPFLAEGN